MVFEQLTCKFCHSREVVKNGKRRGMQYYLCKDCNRGFVNNNALPRMKYPVTVISTAIDCYHAGSSVNKVRDHIIERFDLYPAHSTIYGWIAHFNRTAANKLIQYKPI